MKLYSLLVNSAYSALSRQGKDGAMPRGRNGPWGCEDTPVRNTSNWLKLFLFAYGETGDKAFLSSGRKSLDYLLSEKARPYNAAFYCRRNYDRNKTNGLIGQAWVLESLIESYAVFKYPGIISVAGEVFMLHPFDARRGLWHEIDVDGKAENSCKAFNQQLWFAVMGLRIARINRDLTIEKRVNRFFENIPLNFDTYGEGLIKHVIRKRKNYLLLLKRLKNIRKSSMHKRQKALSSMYHLSLGYHSFNLYAFAMLKKFYPDFSFWKSAKFKKALRFIETEEYEKKLENHEYGFGYNVTGIEIAYVLSVFMGNSTDRQKYWLEKQLQKNYDFQANMLNRKTCDPETLSARLYEATRIRNIELTLATFL